MSEMIDRVAKSIYEATPRNKPYSLLTRFKRDALEAEARAAIEAMRELPEEPGPRYTAGEYSRRTQAAMVDDALSEKP